MTVLAEKSTRFPIRLPANPPFFTFEPLSDGLQGLPAALLFLHPIFGIGLVVEQRVDLVLE